MIQLSLIQTSQNRKKELARFIKSLNEQVGVDFSQIQLIFIDQEDSKDIFGQLNNKFSFQYIKYHNCSLSHARNIGLNYVRGKYIAFPDDDCWYEPATLSFVFKAFQEGLDGIIGRGINKEGLASSTFGGKSQFITKYEHCGAISYSIFLRFNSKLKFDENLGVGSSLGLSSGEETDYLINFMNAFANPKVYYDMNLIIHHPIGKSDYFANDVKKTYFYSRGFGYLLKKHHYPIQKIVKAFVRPFGGILIYGLCGQFHKSYRSFSILKGRIEGFFIHV